MHSDTMVGGNGLKLKVLSEETILVEFLFNSKWLGPEHKNYWVRKEGF